MTQTSTLTDIEMVILLALDETDGVTRELNSLRTSDIVSVSVATDSLVQRDLVEIFEGRYYVTDAGVAAYDAPANRALRNAVIARNA